MINPYLEEYDQKNIIELLKNMGYKYISQEKCEAIRGNRLKEVVLRDIAKAKLMEINSFEYKGKVKKFSISNIEKAIDALDIPLTEGLIKVNEKIYDEISMKKSFDEFLEDVDRLY